MISASDKELSGFVKRFVAIAVNFTIENADPKPSSTLIDHVSAGDDVDNQAVALWSGYPDEDDDPDAAIKTGLQTSLFNVDSSLEDAEFTKRMMKPSNNWIFDAAKIRARVQFLLGDGVMDTIQLE